MRIIQQFDAANEDLFMELEAKFAELERTRPDFPRGKRLQPISSSDPCNTLIWECTFADLNEAQAAFDFFSGDEAHEELAKAQRSLFRQVRREFYQVLDV